MPALILKMYPLMLKTHHRQLFPEFKGVGRFVRKVMIPMACVLAIIVVPSYLAANQNDYYYGSSKIFDETTQAGSDAAAVEEVFGKSERCLFGQYFSSEKDKVYYQGNLDNVEIPWNISLRYYLDGTEYSADEIAGKSGKLEIRFQVTENTACSGTFFDDYALQASFTLDTEQCSNISASDATIANVGSSKPLNLNVEIDDAERKDKVNELIDAAEQLDDGASSLQSGANHNSDSNPLYFYSQ